MSNLLFVSGIADHGDIELLSVDPVSGASRYKYEGNCDFYSHLAPAHWQRKHMVLDATEASIMLTRGTHGILNQISDADTHPKVLDRLQNILHNHPDLPVLNLPEHVLKTRRDRVYDLLKNVEGVVVPKTIRFQPRLPEHVLEHMEDHQMDFPVIVRVCGLHGGEDTVRLDGPEDTEKLNVLPLDGRYYYLIEFIDSATDGVYHKFRIASIQGNTIFRHARYSDEWLVHYRTGKAFMDNNPEYHKQEQRLIDHYETDLKPRLDGRFRAIYEKIPLDMAGADCALLPDGQLLIFEYNASMLFFASLKEDMDYLIRPISKIKTAVIEALDRKIRH